MKNQYNYYWITLSFILILIGAIFSFYYLSKIKNLTEEKEESIITCIDIYRYYNESYYRVVQKKGYLRGNCTINGIEIPEGYRIIYIYQGNITYK